MPQLAFLVFPLGAPNKARHPDTFHVSLSRTGCGALRKPWRRDSATRGSMSQPLPAGPSEMAAADGLCPICLGDLENATYVEVCQHRFCLVCIWEWAKVTETCPLCKQPFKRLLRTVTTDNSYEECLAGCPATGRQPGPGADPHSSPTA